MIPTTRGLPLSPHAFILPSRHIFRIACVHRCCVSRRLFNSSLPCLTRPSVTPTLRPMPLRPGPIPPDPPQLRISGFCNPTSAHDVTGGYTRYECRRSPSVGARLNRETSPNSATIFTADICASRRKRCSPSITARIRGRCQLTASSIRPSAAQSGAPRCWT